MDSDGVLLDRILILSDTEEPPALLSEVLIAGEDIRFHLHRGIDFFACLRAIRAFVLARRLEGASTIEQQLVRTITGDYRLCLPRKLREMCLAAYVCRELPKNSIARAYLNSAYFGHQVAGYRQASDALSVKSANSVEDCALLIAALKVPIAFSEDSSRFMRRDRRRQRVLSLWRATKCGGGASQKEG
jgi:membrane peptidoglycan carboxypeptidase